MYFYPIDRRPQIRRAVTCQWIIIHEAELYVDGENDSVNLWHEIGIGISPPSPCSVFGVESGEQDVQGSICKGRICVRRCTYACFGLLGD